MLPFEISQRKTSNPREFLWRCGPLAGGTSGIRLGLEVAHFCGVQLPSLAVQLGASISGTPQAQAR